MVATRCVGSTQFLWKKHPWWSMETMLFRVFFLRHKHSSAPEHWFSTGCVTLQKWFVFVQVNSLKVPSLLGIKLWLNLRSKKNISQISISHFEKDKKDCFFYFFFMKINGKKGWRSLFCVEAADHPWQPPCEDLPLRHLDEQRFRPEEFDVENLSTDPVIKKDDIDWWKKSGGHQLIWRISRYLQGFVQVVQDFLPSRVLL